ncbi:MAG: hypothetical protein LBB09_00585 [Rickettsiales bacterium]|jgi:hypothetical protein|nr:hypothetical protein [Rickettsiales bacterium]
MTKKVVVIEDNFKKIKILSPYIEAYFDDYEVVTCASIEELKKKDIIGVEIIFMDCHAPSANIPDSPIAYLKNAQSLRKIVGDKIDKDTVIITTSVQKPSESSKPLKLKPNIFFDKGERTVYLNVEPNNFEESLRERMQDICDVYSEGPLATIDEKKEESKLANENIYNATKNFKQNSPNPEQSGSITNRSIPNPEQSNPDAEKQDGELFLEHMINLDNDENIYDWSLNCDSWRKGFGRK